MSGIIAILNLDGAPVDRSLLEHLTRRMSFRGPDAQAQWTEGRIGLGHTLLRATYEAAHEQQPFHLDGDTFITADARLDARQELADLLQARGRAARDAMPDVELILHAYRAWGESCIEHLAGDFVFAIWDAREQKLFCARDQLGIKPLFYARAGNTLVLSNTLRAVRAHPAVTNRLNEQAIGDFLLFGMNYEWTTTVFADIVRLPPAHVLTVRDGTLNKRRYWTLAAPARDLKIRDDAEYVHTFRALLERAVADRLRTPRVGAHLSGGMDSTSVVLLAQHLLKQRMSPFELRTYAIGFAETIPDHEAELARDTAGTAGLTLECLDGEKFFSRKRLPENGFVPDEPLVIPALEPISEINARIAAFGGTLLTGFGGDPLLYPSHTFLRECLARGKWGSLRHAVNANRRLNGRFPPLYLKSALLQSREPIPPMPARHWLAPTFCARAELNARWREINSRNDTVRHWELLTATPFWSNLFSAWDATYTGLPLQVHFPFGDMRLVDLVGRVPAVPWLEKKRLLRAAMYDIVPEQILKRPKTPLAGFPFYGWAVRHGAPHWMHELFEVGGLADFVEPAKLRAMASAPGSYQAREFSRILLPLTLAFWLRESL